eukprot:4459616-Alexandrium_andersonii.AAC.1
MGCMRIADCTVDTWIMQRQMRGAFDRFGAGWNRFLCAPGGGAATLKRPPDGDLLDMMPPAPRRRHLGGVRGGG